MPVDVESSFRDTGELMLVTSGLACLDRGFPELSRGDKALARGTGQE